MEVCRLLSFHGLVLCCSAPAHLLMQIGKIGAIGENIFTNLETHAEHSLEKKTLDIQRENKHNQIQKLY